MDGLLQFYEQEYGGSKVPMAQRARLLYKASGAVDALTCRDTALRAEHTEALSFACCAAADALWEREAHGDVLRETNGDVTIAYRTGGAPSLYHILHGAVFPYLNGTGLLYRGVNG